MTYVDWHPQVDLELESPVYMDSNVFVGAIVRDHKLYPSCAALLGNLLADQVHVLVSVVALDEALWALAKLSYCELANQRPDAHWNRSVYARWCQRIFEAHGARIEAVSTMLRELSEAGLAVEVVPKTEALWNRVMDLTPAYMRQCGLTPADALHLALAETHARTFITADADFENAVDQVSNRELTILHVAKPPSKKA
jgi:predicted nucleic acid-binding protein